MTTRSYAENWEDILLARVFPRAVQGFYLDVGAGDPVDGSVTKLFYDAGWNGINVTASLQRFDAERERDVNLDVDFAVTPLAAVCELHTGGAIDFLALDLPGMEREVLEGGDWQAWRPRVVLVKGRSGHENWEKVLVDAGYEFAAFNGLTRFYVRSEDHEWAAALATPVNAFDDFVPAAYDRRLRELEEQRDALAREVAAARAVNEALRAMYTGVEEVDALRAQTANLEMAATAIQAQCEETRALVAEALSRYELLRRDVVQTRIEVESARSVFRSVGPAGLAVAQRLARTSLKFPKTGSLAKRCASLVKRALR